MIGGFYSSVIGLFDSFCFSFFDLIYFWLSHLFACRFILNLAKFFIVLLYASSNGFGKTKVSVQLNRLKKVIDRSTADGGDGSYRLQSLMVSHVMVMEFLLQAMVTSKKQHQIIWNGNLFDSIIINRAVSRVVLSQWLLLEY